MEIEIPEQLLRELIKLKRTDLIEEISSLDYGHQLNIPDLIIKLEAIRDLEKQLPKVAVAYDDIPF